MWLFAAFVLVPIIEIALFIQVGGAIGLWPTLAIMVGTAILGTTLVRNQGLQAFARLKNSFSELRDPTEPLVHGAMILVSGALLLTPGFFTDAIGFALLLPGIREAVYRFLRSRVQVAEFRMGTHRAGPRRPAHDDIVDGDYEDITPPPRSGPSGWVEKNSERY